MYYDNYTIILDNQFREVLQQFSLNITVAGFPDSKILKLVFLADSRASSDYSFKNEPYTILNKNGPYVNTFTFPKRIVSIEGLSSS